MNAWQGVGIGAVRGLGSRHLELSIAIPAESKESLRGDARVRASLPDQGRELSSQPVLVFGMGNGERGRDKKRVGAQLYYYVVKYSPAFTWTGYSCGTTQRVSMWCVQCGV